MSPFLVLAIGIAFIVVTVAVFRIHAFVALMLAAILVGILPSEIHLPDDYPQSYKDMAQKSQVYQALELAGKEFGETAAKIGLVIVLASIIGQCMMDSGAADMITRRFLRMLGENRSALALLGSSFVLSIPVFFDTVFFLLIPLAKAFRIRTGRNYVLYVMALCAGGALTHSLVAPTPGPLTMAETLRIDLGITIIFGILFAIPPAILGGWYFASWLNRKHPIPLRETPGTSLKELEEIVNRPESDLPPFWLSILPVVLPVVLISSFTVVETISKSVEGGLSPAVVETARVIGNKNLALFLSTAIALWILYRQRTGTRFRDILPVLEPAIAAAGVIILITSAGGAFGKMLAYAGISDALQDARSTSGPVMILIAFGIAGLLKTAQGSGTVSIITTSGIMFGVIGDMTLDQLPYHPIYIFLAIGFGSKAFSWMNDSGFWIVCKLSGFTEKETLKTWTLLLAFLGAVGLVEVLVFSSFLDLKFLPWGSAP